MRKEPKMTFSGKKVLIFAYAFEPNQTSEPGVGWNFSNEIATFIDVTVLTRTNNKEAIEKEENKLGIKYIYHDLPNFFTKYKKKIPFGIQIYFILWQWTAYRKISKYYQHQYDLLHHLTFGTSKNVPLVFGIKTPFIWGPIGGGDKIPLAFVKTMGLKGVLNEYTYRILHSFSNISLNSYFTRKKAEVISFRTESSLNSFPKNGCDYRVLISETATSDAVNLKNVKQIENNLKVISVGRLIQGKGYIYALEGFNRFIKNGGTGSYYIFGDGPEKNDLKAYISKNNLENHVQLMGFVPNDIIKSKLKSSHIFLHPSFREGGSWSIMEAMALGLPVICLNTSGPKDMVTENCGILVDMISPKQVSEDIGNALLELSKNSEDYNRYSENAILRIRDEYNWKKRRTQMKDLYDFVLNKKTIDATK